MTTKKNSKGIYAIITIVIFVVMIAFMFFNDDGLLKYYRLKGNLDKLNQEITQAENQIENLQLEIDSLQNSLIKIEKVAREDYMMLGNIEKVLEIEKSN